ncbi:putative leucine-rich repeat receptor-like serine/threonine-protein kinase At2g19230 [Prosopis cineraria]|uniref:putative leucine-rich repeat receptor-like serine/threonine-protein kinase At2g19230 n=1 Tax=Prosopis cineraria TaxID=364024 RepID=UPI00240FCD19|nr:putative leucine-rich repeat receptor-like serine/threonine-protein kinase At2g19230 [Prosopis cineraria]
MKSTPLWKLTLQVFVSFIIIASHLARPVVAEGGDSGFISIDCGASRDYVDDVTGIQYQTDEGFIESGTNYELSSPANELLSNINCLSNFPTGERQLMTLRSFSEGRRNCYALKPKHEIEQKYLIRALFAYWNYDSKNQGPAFDLYLGVNYWTTVYLFYQPCQLHEIILQRYSNTEILQVCLVNTGQGTPFINTLELRPLNNSLYPAPLPLYADFGRADVGARLSPSTTRYKDDVYDRLWSSYYDQNDPFETNVEVEAEDSAYKLPSEVLRTALQPLNHSDLLTFNLIFQKMGQHYLFLHFAEIQKLPPGHKRIMNVTFDDDNSLSQQLTLEYLKPITLCSNKITKGYINFTIRAAAASDAPPILNAFEVYISLPQLNFPTATLDVNAIMQIKHIYGICRISWQGDPCVPSKLTWDGLNCSSGDNIRIISLNLSSSKLTGQIATAIASLEKLESLDLSKNELIGPLPEFLATLPNLRLIDVSGNKLTGSIPKAFREKANLELRVANNPGLCQTNSCKGHKFLIPLIESVSALVIVSVLVSLVIWRFRKKRGIAFYLYMMEILKPKNQVFSCSEVLCITNNLETTIGEGGFGKVYLGTLSDDTQVAVKLLSPSSRQGYREFQLEAQLLTVIHHRNLVSLVGFCDENDVKALIYEYMDLGDLNALLSDKNSEVLKWNERLQVAVDAARGLEYLHDGCNTPIIHRDLKPSNILLNNCMVAKISDFGLSREFKNEKDSHLSTQPAGTLGYIDPEFQRSRKLNKKSDIYSFGMILLQLITGHPPIRRELEDNCFIIDWIRPKIECGDIQGIVDLRLTGEFLAASAWKAIEIAMSCIAPQSIQRPDISYVLQELKDCLVMEMCLANSNGIPRHSINHSGQLDSISTPSAR